MNPRTVRTRLLRWYGTQQRPMPWRRTPSPYRTWISEIMLQQTQVTTVIPYFERFVRRFPTIRSLARAPEVSVLRRWAGLGYYSRARNLHRAAKTIMADHQGRLPQDLLGLRSLPGVGPYTAAAIASIAFGLPHELVDGNVARVLSRLLALRGDLKKTAAVKRLWTEAKKLLDTARPGDWNQALMELGALVCLPSPDAPRCGECPLRGDCSARRLGLQDRLPQSPIQKSTVRLDWTGLDILRGGRRLLWRRRRTERFLPDHWGLPEPRHLKGVRTGALLRKVTHSITHHRITLHVRAAVPPTGGLPREAKWVPENKLKEYLVSSLWLKATKKSPR